MPRAHVKWELYHLANICFRVQFCPATMTICMRQNKHTKTPTPYKDDRYEESNERVVLFPPRPFQINSLM